MSNEYQLSDLARAYAIATDANLETELDTLTPYAAAVGSSNPFRAMQWYLDGPLSGANLNGANIDAVAPEYTGAGVRLGLIDEGFDITISDLAGRFDLGLSYD